VSKLKDEWRILVTEDEDPYRNMALEESLLLSVESGYSLGTLRFWKNRRSAIIGISQKPEEELNLEICSKHNVSIVKRFTGGGAVYQDLGNLNWTIVCKKDTHFVREVSGVYELYEWLCYPVVAALRGYDLDVKFKPPTGIYLLDRKISGLAMRIKQNALLCHGTLLIHADINLLNLVLRKMKEPVTNINNYTKAKVSERDITEKIIVQVQNLFKIELIHGSISMEEKIMQEKLTMDKYLP